MDSDADPPEMPFGGLPFFGDLGKLFSGMSSGDQGWTAARQLATSMATEGASEPNVDPALRIQIEELARVAEMRAAAITGIDPAGGAVRVLPVTRAQWADRTIDSYRPLFEALTGALGNAATGGAAGADQSGDPMAAMLGSMMQMMGPMMLSMTAGSMVGQLARRSLGQYDLPIPRDSPDVMVVPANLDEFAEEWSLPAQDLHMWICLHEITNHLILGVPHIDGALRALLLEHASGFRTDPSALEERLGSLDFTDPSAMADLQSSLGDPEVILGAIRSPAQLEIVPRLDAICAVVVGIVDWVMDEVGTGLIGSYGMMAEALRRRRVEADPSDRFIERLLGLTLTQAQVDRGEAFVRGVVSRQGPDGLALLWASERNIPTPNEVDAPGLWLARLDLDLE